MEWSTEFPTKPGNYWFYGYRWGRVNCGHKCDPEWMVVRADTCGSGDLIYVADGNFMFESEVEDARFAPLVLPEFPNLEQPHGS